MQNFILQENRFLLMLGVYAEPACMVIGLGIAVVLLVTCHIQDYSKSHLIPCSIGYWFFRSYRGLVSKFWYNWYGVVLKCYFCFCFAVFLVHSYIVIEKRFEDVVDSDRKKRSAGTSATASTSRSPWNIIFYK